MGFRNLIYYILIGIIFIILKLCYTIAVTSDLQFLLAPTNFGIQIITHSKSSFQEGLGYSHPYLNILIDKSCSGFNFWLICFILLATTGLKYFHKSYQKLLSIPIILLLAYFITLFVNISRILFSVNMNKAIGSQTYSWAHQAEGTFIYLSFLILTYLVFNFIIKKTSLSYEKLT